MTLSQIPKDRTVDALASVWSSLRELLGSLTDAQWREPTALPGWDVQAVVAHIIGTESMLAGDPTPEVAIDRDALAHVRNDIGAFNEVWVLALADDTPAMLLERLDDVTARRLTTLREMPQPEWDAESFTPAGPDSYGRFMQIRVLDCWLHEQDIRDALGRPGHGAGQAVVVTLDEMATALGFVVAKRAGAPVGSSVEFRLTGSSGRTVCVEVAERARVVDALDGPATVTITMSVGEFARRCGGRSNAGESAEAVEIDGDADLGRRVIDNLGYMI